MIKKIAMFALAVSAAFSSAFAASDCSVAITPSLGIFSGNQIKPTVTRVMCDDVELTDFSVTYGENINAGANAGTVYVTVKGNTDPIEKKFDIEQKPIKILIDNAEKEKGTKDPVFTWKLAEVKNLDAKALESLLAGLEKFIELEQKESQSSGSGQQVALCCKMADLVFVNDTNDINLLYSKIDNLLKDLKSKYHE